MNNNKNKKGSVIMNLVFSLIIISAFIFIIIIYYDINTSKLNDLISNKPVYKFNQNSKVWIDKQIMVKLDYAYSKLDNGKIICLYGIKSNVGSSINNVIVSTTSNSCNINKDYLGKLTINKNFKTNIYDINCGLSIDQIKTIGVNDSSLTSVMCNKDWFGFYNSKNVNKNSYNYFIVN